MKYEEEYSSERKKVGNGLIVAIVIALLIVAAAAWYALSRYNSADDNPDLVSKMESGFDSVASDFGKVTSEIASDIASGYNNITSSIANGASDLVSGGNGSVPSTKTTNEGVSSVPYKGKSGFTMPVQGEIMKEFSNKELLYSKTFGDMRYHSGIDIACKKGTSVSSSGDGTVLTIDKNGQYGTVVTIDHNNGITAKYCSLADLKVEVGSKLKSGDIIGTVSTIPAECNDAEHLHFEVYKNGVAVSPLQALGLD